MIKHSIRYFIDKKVRAIWDETHFEWWYSAVDVVYAITDSSNPRIYWNALKRRNPQLSSFCTQLKLYADDGKRYLSDVINEEGISRLAFIIPSKNNLPFQNWIKGSLDPLDERSRRKAYELFNSDFLDLSNVGKTILLQQIHAYLFEGLYDFAGKIRTKTISKAGFTFANGDYLPQTLNDIDNMPDDTFPQIVDKYIEMNIAHPFMEGNGRATRIWLDLLLKTRINKCIDWSKIEKNDYLSAMRESPINPKPIFELLSHALTDSVEDRELFMKGIDYSYYYEEEE